MCKAATITSLLLTWGIISFNVGLIIITMHTRRVLYRQIDVFRRLNNAMIQAEVQQRLRELQN